MTASKIVLGAASGAAGGAGLDVDEVFSTDLWVGTYYNENGLKTTVNNGIDLLGEGGLVWLKHRTKVDGHSLFDTARGYNSRLSSNNTNAVGTGSSDILDSFKSTGFKTGANATTNGAETASANSGNKIVSWSFRKAKKFFDVVTYSGNSTAGRTISHNLGCTVGQVWVKRTSHTNNWICWHRGIANNKYLQLNSTSQAYNDGGIFWNNTTPSSTTVTLGSDSGVNATGSTYVMYVFAHNDSGDGEFGPDSDQDIIKCGSYSGSSSAQEITVGFEPQFILQKRTDGTSPWRLHDTMRGMPVGSDDAYLAADSTAAEADYNVFSVTPTGFRIDYSSPYYNTSGGSYIYMAIRRGPLAVPEDATKVFAIDTAQANVVGQPAFESNFVTDHMIAKVPGSSGDWLSNSRLVGTKYMSTNTTAAELNSNSMLWDYNNGVWERGSGGSYTAWMWKRAPGYFDVVCYDGNSSYPRNISHNLGVVPEMMWVKTRNAADNWRVYSKDMTVQQEMLLNGTYAASSTGSWGTGGRPTDSVFIVGSANTNYSGRNYIAYLFATVAGVSKVGSVSHSGSSTDVDCGFSSGARFVFLKRTDDTGSWVVFDTARGITSGNDPYLKLNSTSAQVTTLDQLDPLSSGFQITGDFNDGDYIFYAIA